MPNPEESTYFPRGVNNFVDSMQFASDVDRDGITRVKLGAPIAANTTGIISAVDATAGVTGGTTFNAAYTSTLQSNNPTGGLAKYGRNVTVVASTTYAAVVTVRGRDYLGQPITEAITGNGTTPVAGKKAFKWVDSYDLAAGAANISIGWGNVFGLPYCSDQLIQESLNDAATANAGTFTAAVKTTATSTTGDTRGTYATHASNAPDGTKTFRLIVQCDKDRLHGVKAA